MMDQRVFGLTVSRVTDVHGLQGLAGEWRQLLEASDVDQPFLTHEWMSTWWRHLAGRRRLYLLTVRDGDTLLAVAPFALRPPGLRRLAPFPTLEFLAMDTVKSNHLDLIVRRGYEPAVITALAAYLEGERRPMEFIRVDAAGARIGDLAAKLAENGWSARTEIMGVAPHADLGGLDWHGYLATLAEAHRYDVRRRFRRLHDSFDVGFSEAGSEADRQGALDTLIHLHQMRRNGRQRSDTFDRPAAVRFHHDLTRVALENGWLRLYMLHLDGQPAAALYGFLYRHTFYFYHSGFDPRFGRHSVGLVMLGYSISRAIEEGARRYEFLHGDESYESLWANGHSELLRLQIYAPDAGGMFLDNLMRARKSALNAFRERSQK